MKSVSIIAIGVFALIALCSSVPVVDQQIEAQARLDIYNDFLAGLFSGLVGTTFGSVSNFLNQLISENVLNVGKRDLEQARVDVLTFLYDNILQDFFSGLVSNTFGHLTNTLNGLISTNPLGLGKRDAETDLSARVDILSFLYDNILQDFFSGLVTNTFSHLGNTLNGLISTNPLGLGKRAADGVNIFQFLYENVVADLFGGLASNTANYLQGALQGLLNKPLGIGKRADGVNIFQFLYENVVADLFGGLASNTANYLQGALQGLLNKPLGIGKRSAEIQQAEQTIAQAISTLIEKFKAFAHQAVTVAMVDKQKLVELIKANIADIKAIVANLAKQLSTLIPSTIVNEVSHVLAALQSVLVFWTSGLGGSLGPVIGPFPQ
jgi:hypothetical protein